ncbi:hypothetical protein JW930_02850 [Candidatus Woesearchaeota archaeon]|nr:hypothetical protein [Candidatus Woesearchaeota archaeon]
MGHTVSSQRIVVDTILQELMDYGKSLREDEKDAFTTLLAKVKRHISSISFACSYNTWALILFSILLEHEKELMKNEGNTD